ncbi:MAG TPA: choice-of-anchor D domain-containing protein, partial [Bryobacteraceae bacterium]|nr:choice-of-anchor D domain-containing protein [Bryobacteraceae bacterium]
PTLVSGVPPSGVVLNDPSDVLEDPSGNVFISEYGNCMVRELVKATGLVNIFAGFVASGATTGTCGFSGAGGPATSAELGNLGDIARDTSGNIYIADQTNCVVWEVSASTNDISIFAGVTPKDCGYSGDGGPATSAKLNDPAGVFVDRKNNVYIGDYSNNRIREVTNGTINTIAGDGTAGYIGDGDPATIAELKTPVGVTVDSAGDVYIADYGNCVIREVTAATGIINTIAGTGVCGFNGDGPATEHELNYPSRVYLDANDNLLVTDYKSQRVRWISPAGIMTTIGGNGTAGLAGDGGPALSGEFNGPNGVTLDASGNIFVGDDANLRVRQITAFSALSTSPSSLDFGLVTLGSTGGSQYLTLSALGPLTFSNISVTAPFTEYDDCGSGLSNAATCIMYVFFKPTVTGDQTGAITIEDNGFFTDTTTISLQGTGSALSVTGGPLIFGNEAVKTTSAAKTVTVANKNTASVTMGTVSVNDTDFAIAANKCPAAGSVLAGGASCTISVVFDPKTTGAKKGALVINDSDPSSPQIVGMTGTGTSLVVLSPASLTFPTQAAGTTSALKKVTLTNNTGATLTLQNPPLSVAAPFSTSSATTCTKNLAIPTGGSCVIYVEFAPTAVGYPTGTLSVLDSDATSPQTVSLSGTATAVEFTPPTVSLTSTVGTQVSVSVNIANVGTSAITFTAGTITGPNASDWSTNASDPPCGGSLAPGAPCTFTIYFKPSIVGSESATYLVYDSSTGSPQSLTLSGTGQ